MSAIDSNAFADQKALITGATSGLGKAVAVRLAAAGAEVIVHGRHAERGAKVVAEIEAAGGKARFVAADLTTPDGVTRLAREAADVDVLINNSGASWFGSTPALDAETFDSLFAGNVRAPYFLVAAIAPSMAARGRGSIVNVSSMAGLIGLPVAAAYSATKGAVDAMTRAWAAEFSPSGVRVNSIAPGPTYTDGSNPQVIDGLAPTTLLGRGATQDEIADVIVFLASPAASYVTGAIWTADGGRTAV